LLGIACAVYRVAPYFSSMIPLWYDPWVYRGIFTAYLHLAPWFHFWHVPYRIMHEPLRGILSVIVNKLWISIDTRLTFWLGFFSLLWWCFVFLLTKKYSKQAAIFAMIIFWISIIQYHAFALCYYKQVLWIDVMLALLLLRNNKKYRASIPLLIALILLHRTTTLYLWATSFIFILLQYITTKKLNTKFILVWIISGIAWMALYGPLFLRLIADFFHPLVSTIWWTWVQGDFFSMREFRWFTMFLIAPTLYAVYLKIKHKEYDLIFSWFILWIVRTCIGLLNAKRVELFLDVFMILMTGYALFHLFQKSKWRLNGIVYIFVALQMVYYFWYVSENNTPLITKWEMQSITSLEDVVPENWIVVVTDSAISPRVVGYANRDRIAPWLSDINTRTHTQRNQRRPANGQTKCAMFQVYKKLDRPLYMRESKLFRIEDISWGTCFKFIREDKYHKVYQVVLE
jgi:hypothetical protein